MRQSHHIGQLWAQRGVGLFVLLLVLGVVASVYPRALSARGESAQESTELWETIDTYVELERQAARVPGIALGIVQGDRVVHLQGFGEANPSAQPVTPATRFYIGSNGKSFTAVAIMQLVEQGRLELDAPVQRYLPWFTLADPDAAARLTVRHLLSHTSGLSRTTGLDVALNRDDRQDGALERQVRAWGSAESVATPGTTFQYSNANYVILGLLIETLSGQTYEAYVEEHIFTPLDMQAASFGTVAGQGSAMAAGYRYWFGLPRAADLDYGRVINPAGGLIADVEGMAHYLVAHLNGGRYGDAQLLSPDGIAELHQPVSPVPEQASQGIEAAAYALGWFSGTHNGVPVLRHPGDLPTYHSDILILPQERTGIILLMNANNRLTGERMRAMIEGVADLIQGRPPVPVESGGSVMLLVYRIVLGLALLQVAVIVWSLRGIRRWVRQPQHRPPGRWAWVRHILLPVGFHLLLALLFLVGLPRLMNLPLSLLVESMPDLGAVAIASGILGVAWALVRTVLLYDFMRASAPPVVMHAGAAA